MCQPLCAGVCLTRVCASVHRLQHVQSERELRGRYLLPVSKCAWQPLEQETDLAADWPDASIASFCQSPPVD